MSSFRIGFCRLSASILGLHGGLFWTPNKGVDGFLVLGPVNPERADEGEPGVVGLLGGGVDVGQHLVAEVEVLTAIRRGCSSTRMRYLPQAMGLVPLLDFRIAESGCLTTPSSSVGGMELAGRFRFAGRWR